VEGIVRMSMASIWKADAIKDTMAKRATTDISNTTSFPLCFLHFSYRTLVADVKFVSTESLEGVIHVEVAQDIEVSESQGSSRPTVLTAKDLIEHLWSIDS
jgi:hypothetical protein